MGGELCPRREPRSPPVPECRPPLSGRLAHLGQVHPPGWRRQTGRSPRRPSYANQPENVPPRPDGACGRPLPGRRVWINPPPLALPEQADREHEGENQHNEPEERDSVPRPVEGRSVRMGLHERPDGSRADRHQPRHRPVWNRRRHQSGPARLVRGAPAGSRVHRRSDRRVRPGLGYHPFARFRRPIGQTGRHAGRDCAGCARQESNLRPRAPEARALSPELLARGRPVYRGRPLVRSGRGRLRADRHARAGRDVRHLARARATARTSSSSSCGTRASPASARRSRSTATTSPSSRRWRIVEEHAGAARRRPVRARGGPGAPPGARVRGAGGDRRGAPRPAGQAARPARLAAARAAPRRAADELDGLARRSRRHGAARREGARPLPAPQAQARRPRRARRRARPRRARRRRRPAAAGRRQRGVELSTRRSRRSRRSPSSASSTASSRCPPATRAAPS